MGNLFDSNSLSISVVPPSCSTFDFHTDYITYEDKEIVTFPSFIAKTSKDKLKYCNRSSFNQRLFELGWTK
jgi:hypothetical protein